MDHEKSQLRDKVSQRKSRVRFEKQKWISSHLYFLKVWSSGVRECMKEQMNRFERLVNVDGLFKYSDDFKDDSAEGNSVGRVYSEKEEALPAIPYHLLKISVNHRSIFGKVKLSELAPLTFYIIHFLDYWLIKHHVQL
ncbi:uncharacterized protein LOC144582011 [Callithrix jacchus]